MQPSLRREQIAWTIAGITFVGIVFIAVLWMIEKGKGPKEVIKDNLRLIEVQDDIPQLYMAAEIEWINYYSAEFVENDNDLLKGIEAFRVSVYLDDAMKEVVSEYRVKNKFELFLRSHGIKIQDEAVELLEFKAEGAWSDESKTYMATSYTIDVSEPYIFYRDPKWKQVYAVPWKIGTFGAAGKDKVEEQVLGNVETKAEAFVNAYLAANQ